MLEELKNLNTPCGKKEILYLLTRVLGKRQVSKRDIKILFSHSSGMKIDVDATIKYCLAFSFVRDSHGIAVNENLLSYLSNEELLNSKLIEYTVQKLFEEGYLNETFFYFALPGKEFRFRNELFPLEFSAIRNVLANQGFFVIKRVNQITHFHVAKKYEKILAFILKNARMKVSLEDLKEKLEIEALAGEKAESFVLEYEKARLSGELAKKVQLISKIDVSAGYDIISFTDSNSSDYDCYIEVKAISHDLEFFWSMHEYETAKLHGDQYKLYLVDLSKIEDKSYRPYILTNPAETIMESFEWIVEPQSFHIRKVFC